MTDLETLGTPTHHLGVGSHRIPVIIDEFWTAKQRAGHSIHDLSYRACFKPQLPAYFLERFATPGALVYDPFLGRGTTLVEARLRGCRVTGNDVNPLSRVLCTPRLNPPSLRDLEARLAEIELKPAPISDPELLVFYSEKTLGEIEAWRAYFRDRRAAGKLDVIDAWIEMVAVSRLTGHSAGFFSVYSLPPNQAVSIQSQRKINERRGQVPPDRDTKALIWKKSRQLLSDTLPPGYTTPDAPILIGRASRTPTIADDSVSLVVTSPPFLDTVDYRTDNWMRMWFCGLSFGDSVPLQTKKVAVWQEEMRSVLAELRRVLTPDGIIAFEVGEVRKGNILLEESVAVAGIQAGLTPVAILIHTQEFTKTSNCWGVNNNAKGTNSNRIVVFRK